jgi:uncharacterized protein YqgQ
MRNEETPLRILVKSYTNGLLSREQYLEVRHQLLRILSHRGDITQQDLQKLLKKYEETDSTSWLSSYSASDWVIVALGLLAAAALGYILYS